MGSSQPSLLCLLPDFMSQIKCPHFPEGETETLRRSSSLWAFNESFYQGWLGMRGARVESPKALWNSYVSSQEIGGTGGLPGSG